MTPEEIIAMAKEARISEMGLNIDGSSDLLGLFERFAALVAAAEREACAKVCDKEAVRIVIDSPEERAYNNAVSDCAAAIRARGKK